MRKYSSILIYKKGVFSTLVDMNFQNYLKAIGPGILFASTAIGVSHLVQSTRAGAFYGFELVWAIILANLFKYPFFEFGSRYANVTGKSIIDGYQKIGNWVLISYFIITIGSMFFVTAAVGAVTAGFMDNLFGISNMVENGGLITVFLLFIMCTAVLLIGKYKLLDASIKIIGGLLLISTITAFILALLNGPTVPYNSENSPALTTAVSISFLIALMGWMPTAVDLSSWNSLWTVERIKQSRYHPKLKETLFDFNFGYIISALLSLCFVTLGAYLVFGTNKVMPDQSSAFANEVISLYTQTIGNWSYFLIAIAAFSIMLGTSFGIFDGYARALKRCIELIFSKTEENSTNIYSSSLVILAIGSFFIIFFLGKSLKFLVDLATTISFLIAPVVAIVNYKLVTSKKYIDARGIPPFWLKTLSWLGILFLSGFSIFFVVFKLFQ